MRNDSNGAANVRRIDLQGRLDGVRRTSLGGIKATATLTRVGVFPYRKPEGGTSLELRHPDDIFNQDSLETLKGVPVTIGHPGLLTSKNWKAHAIGHVGDDVRVEGKYIKATLIVQDNTAAAHIESGKLKEVSLGYEVEVEPAAGTFDGQEYNARQRGHVYNHAALGPEGWGRAGRDVCLQLDGEGEIDLSDPAYAEPMRTDAQDPPAAPKTNDAATVALASQLEKVQGRCDALESEVSRLKAENDKLTKAAADAATARQDSEKTEAEKFDQAVRARVHLEHSARAILGEKFDAAQSDDDIKRACILARSPEAKLDGKSGEYISARFDALAEQVTSSTSAAVAAGKLTGSLVVKGDAGSGSRAAAAIKVQADALAKQGQAGPPEGAAVASK